MEFWDQEDNLDRYLEMADGFDGRELVDHLATLLPAGASVLELGMGPGKDLLLLAERFSATGSDFSQAWVDRFVAAHPEADVLRLDAVELATDRCFDGIYSNKVLHHLSGEQLARSLTQQRERLNEGGVLLHSLWRGEGVQEIEGMTFSYYEQATLEPLVPEGLELVEVKRYREMEDDDSLRVVLRRR